MKAEFIKDEIKDQYLIDSRPWIIGFSGGKDSTAVLQLVWYAIKEIPVEQRHKEIHVVCNDTLVENPRIVEWIDQNLDNIVKSAEKDKLPIIVAKTNPELEDSFWVNLIGKGYPAPNNTFRWCTERLKINPTSRYIKAKVAEKGEVVILLGTRTDESETRKKSMNKFQVGSNRLKRHVNLNLAFVYSPISHLTTNELWEYLMQVPNPWNGSNRSLITLYRNGSGGDCPLVIDTTTPSCGQSRFGCWVCTVVKKDKSMEAFIENGEEKFEPLLDLRDWLVDNRDKDEYRMQTRRNGSDGKGPYNIYARKLILNMLFEAQKISEEKLISTQEMKAIQILWQMDGYYENVFELYYNVFNEQKSFEMSKRDEIKKQQVNALTIVCEDNGIDPEKMLNLLRNEKDKRLLKKRLNIQSMIDDLIKKEIEA
ncbi:MAG: DNA phosphorothioation system sulfurtransferase DndC [Lewinellaceae bacterium]|nr:DNA phosphorothioation system sulfurtransferase DndC [Lewinellaceae bacterium]